MQEFSVELPHISLTGLTFGDETQVPILALHGWLDNAASFVPLANCLPDHYIVAVDFAGHGKSGHRSHDAFYHQMDFVYDLHCFIEKMGWSEVIILGHSMGAIIGATYAAAFPEKVTKLVLMEAFGFYTEDVSKTAEVLRKGIESRIERQKNDIKQPKSLEGTIKARALGGKLTQASATLLIERNVEHKQGLLRWRTDRRLRNQSVNRFTEEQAIESLKNIACETLLILGEQGYEQVKTAVNSRRSYVSQLTSVTLKGGHHLHMDNPQPIAHQLMQFL